MARYGIIEPLAPEICSRQFSKYITSQANQTLNKVLNRVKKIEAMADASIYFHNLQGDPAQAIQKFVLQQTGKTILVIGKRAKKQGFFNIKSDLAKKLTKKCADQELQVSEI